MPIFGGVEAKIAIVARWRRVAASWHTEIDDRAQMARLRARVIVLTSAVTMVILIGLFATSADQRAEALAVVFEETWLGVIVVHSLVRRQRMVDVEFFGLVVMIEGLALLGVALRQGQGHVAATALAEISPLIMAALFLESLVLLVAQFVVLSGLIAGVAVTAPPGPGTSSDLGNALITLLVLLISLRVLRGLSMRSVSQAKRGEVTDPLTGLANRRGLERWAGTRWGEFARNGRSVAVLVVDVDHFKRINDTAGHAGGDEILRDLAAILPEDLRDDDIVVRLGGEEFAVVAPVAGGGGVVLAERIRRRVEGSLAPVTVSIGVHEFNPAADDDAAEAVWDALDVADQALYQAKHGGRNQVRLASPEARPGEVPPQRVPLP